MFAAVDWDKALSWLSQRTEADLAPEQADAVRLALTAKVAVLTGGPGCGKSFTVRSVVELARAKGAKIVLAAPAGRAAKRLAELAGHEAATIHRLLQLRPGGDPSFDAEKPLDADLVVIDETSMVDVILAGKLIKAVPPGAHLLLVGDIDQLPSVGAGEVLRDARFAIRMHFRVAARRSANEIQDLDNLIKLTLDAISSAARAQCLLAPTDATMPLRSLTGHWTSAMLNRQQYRSR